MRRLSLLAIAASVLALSSTLHAAEPLKIAYSDWPGWVAFEVGIQKGWFKEAGVDVQFVWMEYGPSMEAFQAFGPTLMPIIASVGGEVVPEITEAHHFQTS